MFLELTYQSNYFNCFILVTLTILLENVQKFQGQNEHRQMVMEGLQVRLKGPPRQSTTQYYTEE